jgi:hypothetical protein
MQDPTVFLSRLARLALIPIGLLLLLGAAFSVWTTKAWLARTLKFKAP